MKPKVSIIIAAYNEEQHLDACLMSLKKQTYSPLEIIVGNDGSTDETENIIKKHDITSFYLNHVGTALIRNFAVKNSKGTIVSFLDADMEFDTDFIEKLAEPIIKERSKGTFSKLEYVKNWDKPLARCWNRNNTPALPDKLRVPQNKDEGEDFRAILKSEFERVGGFDNVGYNDTWSLAKKLGYKPTNAPGAIYYHNNPESFMEIFEAAAWIGKRQYKLGRVGTLIALIRANIIFSILMGIFQTIRYREPLFLPFKIVYNLGISYGALTSMISGDVKK